jgi:hypothetical protein
MWESLAAEELKTYQLEILVCLVHLPDPLVVDLSVHLGFVAESQAQSAHRRLVDIRKCLLTYMDPNCLMAWPILSILTLAERVIAAIDRVATARD